MKKVYQRNDNDCLVCVLATLTGIRYEDIPQIGGTKRNFYNLLEEWLEENDYVEYFIDYPSKILIYCSSEITYCIGYLEHEGTKWGHAVILKLVKKEKGMVDIDIFHDPAKDSGYDIDDLKFIGYLSKKLT